MIDRAIKVWPQLDGFLAESAPANGILGSFERLKSSLTS